MSQRNGLLKQSGGQTPRKAEFDYWDEQLTGLGSFLVAARFLAARTMATRAATHFAALAPEVQCLGVAYESTLQQDATWWSGFDQSTANDSAVQRVSVAYEKRLAQSFQGDVQRGVSQVGPHRDDVAFTVGDRLLARFGSRGQQRLAVVALKLAEIDYLRESTGAFPVFMLDDVLSELDPNHRETLLRTVFQNGAQMIVTATDESLLDDGLPGELGFARLSGSGQIQQ